MRQLFLIAALLAVAGLCAGPAGADTSVELSKVHLCCGQCVNAVKGVLGKIDGVTGKCDQKGKTIAITAKDDAGAQKALDALAAAGFHGESNNKSITQKDDSGVKPGKVKSLTLEGIHNCCGMCNNIIKATVKKVEGVSGDTAKVREGTFEVTGDFDAAELVKALYAAGFHVKVKK
jgi:copper chaperone CopZ